MTKHDMEAMLRTYMRERAAQAGYHTALTEIQEAVMQLRLHGSAPTPHAMPAEAMRRRAKVSPYPAACKSVGPL